jgi:hypothetical protein
MSQKIRPGTYFVSHTLLSTPPDTNKRIIRRYPDMEEVCILNPTMRAWTDEDEQRLQAILGALNTQVKA